MGIATRDWLCTEAVRDALPVNIERLKKRIQIRRNWDLDTDAIDFRFQGRERF